MLTSEQIQKQSEAAYSQWAVQWREHAQIHSKFQMKSLMDFENIGIGKACLLVANGFSFEEEIETIIKYQDRVDILCCDKTLGHLINAGVKPTYCLVADANVNYEKYLEPFKDDLSDTVLFINVCGNPKWTANGNWKDKYFFANRDILKSEVEFMKISGCKNSIPAATNVSNAMVVFLTQSDNRGFNNFFGYDKYLLTGFDYSWDPKKSYYAFDTSGSGKINYMNHIYLINSKGDYVSTSTNLLFSCKWLHQYITTFRLSVVQCSKGSILELPLRGHLWDQMQYDFRSGDSGTVRSMIKAKNELVSKLNGLDLELNKICKLHLKNVNASI